jgi:hypothetical protein
VKLRYMKYIFYDVNRTYKQAIAYKVRGCLLSSASRELVCTFGDILRTSIVDHQKRLWCSPHPYHSDIVTGNRRSGKRAVSYEAFKC